MMNRSDQMKRNRAVIPLSLAPLLCASLLCWSIAALPVSALPCIDEDAAISLTGAEIIARVQVQHIKHALRPADINRIQHGAPPPLNPYYGVMEIRETVPPVKDRRVILEGISTAAWMPTQGSAGIVLLSRDDKDLNPTGLFPSMNFLPEKKIKDQLMTAFPFDKGMWIPSDWVWDCLRALVVADPAMTDEEKIELYTDFLLDAHWEKKIVGLFFLLHRQDAVIPWSARPFSTPSIKTKGAVRGMMNPLMVCMTMLALYGQPEQIPGALDAILELVADDAVQLDKEHALSCCARLIRRAADEVRPSLMESLFLCAVEREGVSNAFVDSLGLVEEFLDELSESERASLVKSLLWHSENFPLLRNEKILAEFWKALYQRHDRALPEFLDAFLDDPATELPHFSTSPQVLEELVAVAEKLHRAVKVWNTP